MRLVLTLRTRDHEDLVGANVAYHLSAGVDFVIATDHLSADGTRDALRAFERAGRLRLLCKDHERYEPGRWVNDMAALAVTEHGADWVIHADTDEFWWPRGGSLGEVLSLVPPRFGAVFGPWRHFAPRPDDGTHFAERMTLRLGSHARWTAPEHPFHPNVNVAHRARRDVLVTPGNHDIAMGLPVLRGWFPLEVLHFPLRSLAQAEAKFSAWQSVLERPADVGPHVGAAAEALQQGAFRERYERYVVPDDAIERGIRSGEYAVDTRVRDALRLLWGRDAGDPLPAAARFTVSNVAPERLRFPDGGVAAAAALAEDTSVFPDPGARVRRRVEEVEARLAALERKRGFPSRHRTPSNPLS
jgi:Glycosyl transferase family 2